MGELVLYRIVRPWIFSDYTYAITQAGKEQSRLVKILHSFSTSVIEDREVNFVEPTYVEDEDGGVYRSKRRLAMLDLLLSAKKAGAPIDNEGIREEVDTFMFEVRDNIKLGKYMSSSSRRTKTDTGNWITLFIDYITLSVLGSRHDGNVSVLHPHVIGKLLGCSSKKKRPTNVLIAN